MKPFARLIAPGLLALGIVTSTTQAQTQWCSSPYYVEQAFPIAGPEQTRWKLCWQVLNGPNLVITSAWFRAAPQEAWIKLVYDARLSQLFVPYHPGSPRYYDIGYGFGAVPLVATDCPSPGVIIGANSETCKQVRDRGLAWKHDGLMRRGEELILWSVMAAANYNYIVEWSFRDDGVVTARVGATGQIAGTQAHMHGPVWRLDLDLNGAWGDVASWFKHTETGAAGSDTHSDVTSEAGRAFDAPSFPMVKIRDQMLTNSQGQHRGWHLVPLIFGTPKHQETFTQNAFWATSYKWSEKLGDQLPSYVSPAEPILGRDVVLWYYSGLHHLVRKEDTNMTHVMWTGFMLMPSNVWTGTPLYP
jgi:primary-amine oxidase